MFGVAYRYRFFDHRLAAPFSQRLSSKAPPPLNWWPDANEKTGHIRLYRIYPVWRESELGQTANEKTVAVS